MSAGCGPQARAAHPLVRHVTQPLIQDNLTNVQTTPNRKTEPIKAQRFEPQQCEKQAVPRSPSLPSPSTPQSSKSNIESTPTSASSLSTTSQDFHAQSEANALLSRVEQSAKDVSKLQKPAIMWRRKPEHSTTLSKGVGGKSRYGSVVPTPSSTTNCQRGHSNTAATHVSPSPSKHDASKKPNKEPDNKSHSNDPSGHSDPPYKITSAKFFNVIDNQNGSLEDSSMWDVEAICPRLLSFRDCECAPNPCIILRHPAMNGAQTMATAKFESWTVRTICAELLTFKTCRCGPNPCMVFNIPGWESQSREKKPKKKKKSSKKRSQSKKKNDESLTKDSNTDSISFSSPTASTIPASEFPSLPLPSRQKSSGFDVVTSSSPTPNYASITSKDQVQPIVKKVMPSAKKDEPWDANELRLWIEQNLSPATQVKCVPYPPVKQPSTPRQIITLSVREQLKESQGHWPHFSMLPAELKTLIWKWAILMRGATVYVRYQPSRSGDIPGSIQYMKQNSKIQNVNRETRYLCRHYPSFRFGTSTTPAEVPFHFRHFKLFIHNAASIELKHTIMDMIERDRHRLLYLSIPLRDFIAKASSTTGALCECPNLVKVWFVLGESVQDQEYVKEHFRNEAGLRKTIYSHLHPRWKKRWAKLPAHQRWVLEKVPQIEFEVVDPFRAAAMKIDNLRWC